MVTIEENLKSANFFAHRFSAMGLSVEDEMVMIKEMDGKNKYTYKKYEQYYKGVPVFGSAYTLRIKEGMVKRASGYYLPLIDLSVEPSILKNDALKSAMDEMQAEEYSWENTALRKMPAYAKEPIAKLVIIDTAYPSSSEDYKLAYQVDLQSTKPVDKKRYFIDAQTGIVLLDLPLLMHQSVPGKGQCRYYGEQSFTVDSIGPNEYQLRDMTRGEGNAVFNSNGEIFTDSDNFWDLTNENQDEVAVDAHFCTEKFYDLMLNAFGWDGIDNNGGSMNCIVHAGDFVNAFWDGNTASFGDGDCNSGPLTTYEVVAHEFMHGITENSSALIYFDESGAINESMSDIFGKALEYYEDPSNFEWTIGQSFIETQYARPFRSFSNPNQFNHPKFYQGDNWSTIGSQVHTNSSVGNHWFYLLVNGGNGTDEIGRPYEIQGVGMEKALQIVFLTQTTALIPNSNYSFYAQTSIVIAEELYGTGSPEVLDIQAAWNAVGVTAESPKEVVDLGFATVVELVDTCLTNAYIPIEITISNLGDAPYHPNMNGFIDMQVGLFPNTRNEIFKLNDILFPGESITYTLDDLIFIESGSADYVAMEMHVDNEIGTSNNFKTVFVINTPSQSNDLALANSTFFLSKIPTCFGGTTEISMAVVNTSCSIIESNTPFDIQIFDDKNMLLWTKPYSLPTALDKNERFRFSEEFDLSEFDTKELIFVLDYADDIFEMNNSFSLSKPEIAFIDSNFLQEFDDEEIPEFEITGATAGRFTFPFSYENENYFASSANNSNVSGIICPNPEDIFSSSKLSLEFCLDSENLINPSLDFDLIQFRGSDDLEFPDLTDNTNMVKVSWTDGQNDFEDIILGQPEGELVNHRYILPDNSRGIVKLEFFNYVGNSQYNTLRDDVTLLDNLSIGETVTSTNDQLLPQFEIIPNPTTGVLTLNYSDIPDALIVRNIHGQEVINISPSANSQKIDVQHLPQGIYPVTLIYGDNIITRLISKIDK